MTDLTQRIRERHERWKDAPEWAEWCAIHDGDGSIRWLRQKPNIEGNPNYDFEPRPHPDEIALLERVDALEHYYDSTVGLWAADRPEMISDPKGHRRK